MNTKQSTHILLIEDNPGDAHLVNIYMKDAAFKFDMFHAETLFEGQDIITKHEIDIVLLDLSLPDTQGFKTLNVVGGQGSHFKVRVSGFMLRLSCFRLFWFKTRMSIGTGNILFIYTVPSEPGC